MDVKTLKDLLAEVEEDRELIFDGHLWVVEATMDDDCKKLRRLSDDK